MDEPEIYDYKKDVSRRSNNNPSKKKKRTVKKGRVLGVGAVFVAGLTLISMGGIKKLKQQKQEKTEQSFNLAIDALDGNIDYFFDGAVSTSYFVGNEFELFAETGPNGELTSIETINPFLTIDIYGMTSIQKTDGDYYYCEVPSENKAGLVNINTLGNTMRTTSQYGGFDQIYLAESGVQFKSSPDENGKTLLSDSTKTVIFARKQEDENSKWLAARTGDGKIGYVQKDDNLQLITDGELMEISELYDGTGFYPSERVVVIDDGIDKDFKLVIHCDEKGVLRSDDVPKEFLKAIDFSKEREILEANQDVIQQSPQNIPTATQDVVIVDSSVPLATEDNEVTKRKELLEDFNNKVLNWQEDITTGIKGIDVSWIDVNTLDRLLTANPDFKFGIVRIGGITPISQEFKTDGYGVIENESEKQSKIAQIQTFKNHNIDVAAYFYSADSNPEEGYKLAELIERNIDELGGGMTPILDAEFGMEKKDRSWFLESINFDSYIKDKNISPEDAQALKNTLDRLRWLHTCFIENYRIVSDKTSTPEQVEEAKAKQLEYGVKLYGETTRDESVMKYVDYCQDLKAQSISAAISKLHKDGYIKGNSTVLYTGNQSVSKDSNTVEVDGGGYTINQIVLFKYDDVKRYLTDPSSEYYISSDFDLRIWFADYTSSKNYTILGDASTMVQREGNAVFEGEYYDLNYMCPEFYDYFLTGELHEKEEVQQVRNLDPNIIIQTANTPNTPSEKIIYDDER